MQATLKPKQADDPHDFLVVAPDAVRVAPVDEELTDLLHQAARQRSDTQANAASDAPAGPTVPPVDTTFRPAAVDDLLGPGDRGSMAGRVLRASYGVLLAACIGVAAIVWRSYGDTAERQIVKWTTQFALASSLSAPDRPTPPAQPTPPSAEADAANAPPPQSAALVQTPPQGVAPGAAAPAADSPQLQAMARDLATVTQEVEQLKASIEQLKASQQQAARVPEPRISEPRISEARVSEPRVSEVKPSEPTLRPRISAPPPRPAVARVRKPAPPYPPQQAAVVPPAVPQSQAAAPYMPRQIEPPPQAATEPPADPELSSVPRPPMPLRP